ncbi:MAG: glycine--tRNA ligase subunit alpha, partial [SAR324 cluster bacterium]|nr:glycine--tRNA ligase subunit alpha [SAR324 cluster bacterium]
MSLQNIIMALHDYWNRHGCLLMNPYDVETGAGTMNPMTTLR